MVNPYRFYTYAYLREDKTPYYIGKGEGRRVYCKHSRSCSVPKDKSRIIFLKKNLAEEEAFKHEIYMISIFGRMDLGTGILRNLTDGGEGTSGSIRTEKFREKLSLTKKGRKVWTDGCGNMKMSYECPGEGWVLGVSEESKKKNSISNKNRKWWVDENGNVKRTVECPGEGWILGISDEFKKKKSLAKKGEKNNNYGKKWWNDGCGNMKLAVECPCEGWILGRSEESKNKQSLAIKNKNERKI
jgi:hypothetical protein